MTNHCRNFVITLLTLSMVSLFACKNILKSDERVPSADAGPDQETLVGSYAVMDPSRSTPGENGAIGFYEWRQDPYNPAEVMIHSSSDYWKYATGFTQEGVYRFTLIVHDTIHNTQSAPDELLVFVRPRKQGLIEDTFLEMHVRYALRKQTGDLTLADLSTLDTLSAFHVSRFWSWKIESLQGIQYCEALIYLSLSSQVIADLSPLANLTNLTYLNIDQNRRYGEPSVLTDISPLAGLTRLRHLNLLGDNVSDLTPLQNLTELRYLNLMDNPIQDVAPLANLNNMEKLYCSRSQICDISPLSEMTHLSVLWLSRCKIADLSPIQNLTDLQLLWLRYNNISDIAPLQGLRTLQRLYLHDNNITDISALDSLPALALVDLGSNHIVDVSPLVRNNGLGRGDILDLHGNPLSAQSINEYLPALRARGVYVNFP